MTEHQTRVIYQEVPRDFRTEIPNIVFALLEAGHISNSDFMLYCTYRRIAGENGACWMGTRSLAKKCGLSHPTITNSKKNLSKPFEALGGKSLIEITPCDRKKEQADTIIIVDIWPENFNFFKKRLTCEKREHTGVQKDDTRVCKKTIQKNEQSKKEPYIKKSNSSNVHKSVDASIVENVHNSPSSESPPNSIDSILLNKKDNSIDSSIDIDSPEFLEILEMEHLTLPLFRPEILARWIKKFGAKLVLETLKFFFKIKSTQKKPIPKPEAWMETALKQKFSDVDKSSRENKEFAENFKKAYRLWHLKINKRYCQNTQTGKDYSYNLPPNVFRDALHRMIE